MFTSNSLKNNRKNCTGKAFFLMKVYLDCLDFMLLLKMQRKNRNQNRQAPTPHSKPKTKHRQTYKNKTRGMHQDHMGTAENNKKLMFMSEKSS